MSTRYSYTRILMFGLITAFAAVALPTAALAGGGGAAGGETGGEPGAGCRADPAGNDALEAVRGAPLEGMGTVRWIPADGGTVTIEGTLVQFGNEACQLVIAAPKAVLRNIPKEEFTNLHPNDLRGFCITDIENVRCFPTTEFHEILAAGQLLSGQEGGNPLFTVRVLALPVAPPQ